MQRVQIECQPNDWIIIALRQRQLFLVRKLFSLPFSNALAVFDAVWIAARRQSVAVQQSQRLREPTTRPSARGKTTLIGHDCGLSTFVTVLRHHTVQLPASVIYRLHTRFRENTLILQRTEWISTRVHKE